MYNINFNIGCYIDKEMLRSIFDSRDGFIAATDPQCRGDVLVHLPYTVEDGQRRLTKRKKSNPTKHTFTVYKTGAVTQSGPGGERGEDAYNRFFKIILDHYELIKI